MSYFAAAAAGYGAANHYAAAFGAGGFGPSVTGPTASNSFITSQQVRWGCFWAVLILKN